MKSVKRISLVFAIAMLILAMGIATTFATSDINDKNNTRLSIESKEKNAGNYKITWNANGGKIGSKKTKLTNLKRGSKIGKLVATPKRSNYSFKGWYNKKIGGKKITKNTKPTKSVTYYAQWQKKKNSRVLTTEEKKLIGEYMYSDSIGYYDTYAGSGSYQGIWSDFTKLSGGSAVVVFYFFYADGTYKMQQGAMGNLAYTGTFMQTGKWAVKNPNKITLTNRVQNYTSDSSKYQSYKNKILANEQLSYIKGKYNGQEGYYIDWYWTPAELQEMVGSKNSFYQKNK